MSLQPKSNLTPQEYLAIERKAETKGEYLDGEIFAMTGASREHNVIVTNVLAGLHSQLRGRPCEAYANDMRVKVSPAGLYTYLDIAVVCGTPHFEDDYLDTLLNPTVIIEVLSESTEGYDRGRKFEMYRALGSLQDYLLIAQDKPHVECFARQPDHRWLLSETNSLQDRVRLLSIDCELLLADIYDRIDFGKPP